MKKNMYQRKQKAIERYMQTCAPCGTPWSGALPKQFLDGFRWEKEVFFKAD
jgi:hypothetical protein